MRRILPTEAPAAAKVERTVREWIRNGRLGPRMRLPTEHALGQQTGVSRTTVRSALRLLHRRGAIAPVVNGRGWIVSAAPADAAAPFDAAARPAGVVGGYSGLARRQRDYPPDHASGRSLFVLVGILQALAENGYTAAVRQAPETADPNAPAADCPAWIATGDVVADPAARAWLARLQRAGAPVAAQYDGDEDLPFDRVASDHAAGAAMLAEWLFARGCRRILPYFPTILPTQPHEPEAPWLRQRVRGFAEAHARAGRAVPDVLPAHTPHVQQASPEGFLLNTDLAHAFLCRAFAADPGWDAVMCLTDGFVMPMAAALRRFADPRRHALPVTGYDNYWNDCLELAWSGHRPAATVDKLNSRLGRETVAVLEERRRRPAGAPPIVRRLRPELRVVRP